MIYESWGEPGLVSVTHGPGSSSWLWASSRIRSTQSPSTAPGTLTTPSLEKAVFVSGDITVDKYVKSRWCPPEHY